MVSHTVEVPSGYEIIAIKYVQAKYADQFLYTSQLSGNIVRTFAYNTHSSALSAEVNIVAVMRSKNA